jgi:hypothetical protein
MIHEGKIVLGLRDQLLGLVFRSLFQGLDPLNERGVGVIKPGIDGVGVEICQVVPGEALEGMYQGFDGSGQVVGICIGLPLKPS